MSPQGEAKGGSRIPALPGGSLQSFWSCWISPKPKENIPACVLVALQGAGAVWDNRAANDSGLARKAARTQEERETALLWSQLEGSPKQPARKPVRLEKGRR